MDPKDLTGHAPAGMPAKADMTAAATVTVDPQPAPDPEVTDPFAGITNTQNSPDAAVAPAPAPEPVVAPPDSRQWWECVTPEGPRTRRNGVECPEFQSDSHIVGHLDEHGYPQPPVPVKCPTCGGKSIRKQGARTLLNEAGRALPPLHG